MEPDKDKQILLAVCYAPHPEVHSGEIAVRKGTMVSPFCRIDLTGSIEIGELCMIGEGVQILTHDHYHEGHKPLLELQKEKGVKWQDKKIGNDVWLHQCVILYQVTEIPDGVVVGVGSVLTKNPDTKYGIYAGNPAKLIGLR